MKLGPAEIRKLHAAAISAGLGSSRAALLAGIDSHFVASLPSAPSHAAQLLTDLDQLDSVPQLADGSIPLLIWLQNAAALAGPRTEGIVFDRAAQQIMGDVDAPSPPPPPPADAPSPKGVLKWREGTRGAQKGTQGMPDVQREGAVQVFVSAAAKDERFVQTLEQHLFPLIRGGSVDLWHTGKMPGGVETRTWIAEHLDAADLVLLMVSADFLSGEPTYEQMERALALQAGEGTRVVPVVVRPVDLGSTPLASMPRLPRSGLAISSSSDADKTYTEIVAELRSVVADLQSRRNNTKSVGISAPPVAGHPAAATPPGARLDLSIDDVFTRNGVPDETYVEPEQADEIRRLLARWGRALVLEGPTQIGKTTALTKLLPADVPCKRLDMYDDEDREVLPGFLKKGAIKGHLVVENAHHLDDATLSRVARLLRVLSDTKPAESKVTLLGISNVRARLEQLQPDLAGRFDPLGMNHQPKPRLRQLVQQGERAANLRFDHAEEIVAASRGSFRLAQELCYQCARVAGIDRVNPGPPRPVATLPDDVRVREVARLTLDGVFEDPVARFAGADHDVNPPGACLALLWLLSLRSDGRLLISAAGDQYSMLGAAFRWVQGGHLATWLRAPENASVATLLAITAGELRAPDPRFLYYLSVLDWKQLGRRAGLNVLVPSESLGDLQIIPAPRPDPGGAAPPDAASIARGSLVDAPPPFPWWHPSALTLLRSLASAYTRTAEVRFVAAQVQGFEIGQVDMEQSLESVWRAVLEAAASQRKLRELLGKVLEDNRVVAYHPSIRAALAPP
jgi:hypothetical protein